MSVSATAGTVRAASTIATTARTGSRRWAARASARAKNRREEHCLDGVVVPRPRALVNEIGRERKLRPPGRWQEQGRFPPPGSREQERLRRLVRSTPS